jgi:hypothetical protein
VAGLGGLLLLGSLFGTWYSLKPGAPAGLHGFTLFGDATAWSAFTIIDVLLALLALLAIAVAVVAQAATGPAKPVAVAVIASAFGWIAILLVTYRLIYPPGGSELVTVGGAAWLALGGAIAAWVGSWLSLRDESTPGALAPDIPRRPAPATG